MVRIDEHLRKIEEVQRLINSGGPGMSWKRRRDLFKYRKRLVNELNQASRFLSRNAK